MRTEELRDLEELERALTAMAAAASPSEALEHLVEGSLLASPRVALFLVRQGRIKGWRSAGYAPEAARKLAGVDLSASEEWQAAPDFGQGNFEETVVVPLHVGGAVLGILVAERAREEAPWRPPLLRILAVFAQTRLDLDLAQRRGAAPLAHEAGPVTEPPVHAAVTVRVAVQSSETGLALVAEEPELGRERDRRPEEARRFARLVATDIRLYNEEAVLLGRRQRDLARRLADQLQRGRESFVRRFPDMGPDGLALLEEAYVEVLAAGDVVALSS